MNNGPNARQAGFGQDHFRALYSQVLGLKRELHDARKDNNHLHERHYRMMQQLDRSIRRIALQPVQHPRNEQAAAAAIPGMNTATLLKNPRSSIYILWQEFEFGIGIAGRKAAKAFTAEERGRVKYNYHRRKVVWDKISEMIRAGHTSNTAIDAIYDAYGRASMSVTAIIIQMLRQDKRTGCHPTSTNLRV
jgi:hypothetical protein